MLTPDRPGRGQDQPRVRDALATDHHPLIDPAQTEIANFSDAARKDLSVGLTKGSCLSYNRCFMSSRIQSLCNSPSHVTWRYCRSAEAHPPRPARGATVRARIPASQTCRGRACRSRGIRRRRGRGPAGAPVLTARSRRARDPRPAANGRRGRRRSGDRGAATVGRRLRCLRPADPGP